MSKVAVMGYGTVGSGVVNVIDTNHDSILQKTGIDLEVKYILDLREFPGDKNEAKIVHDYNVILQDPEIEIVVETMGGVNPALPFSMQALESGKSVCSSNKELVARHGSELLKTAKDHHVSYLFEASCGGGIPIIRPLRLCLAQEQLDEITGILNGTTNFILTKMIDEGLAYEEVLKEAQALGYAEKNPAADVEGHDACRKIAILSSLAYGKRVSFEEIYTEGITKISSEDITYAKSMNKTIKLLAYSHKNGDEVIAMVAPYLVDRTDPLSGVSGVFNAIYVHGNMLGDAMFYGQGAGKDATASAVVSDVIEAARMAGTGVVSEWAPEKQTLTSVSDTEKSFFFRASGNPSDEKIYQDLLSAFGSVQIIDAGINDEFGVVTQVMTEKAYADCSTEFAARHTILGMIRIR